MVLMVAHIDGYIVLHSALFPMYSSPAQFLLLVLGMDSLHDNVNLQK